MISGKILRDAIISGANNINNQRSRVDELNVFPVPDGDTGTNMGMTVGAAVRELQAMDDSCTVGEAAKTAASAMLRGARGNSGVITYFQSSIFRNPFLLISCTCYTSSITKQFKSFMVL